MASFRDRFEQSHMVQAVGVYAASAWIVLEVVGLLRENLGLPHSVFVAALVLLAIGLVVVVATAWVQARPGLAERAKAEEVPLPVSADATIGPQRPVQIASQLVGLCRGSLQGPPPLPLDDGPVVLDSAEGEEAEHRAG